MIAPFLQELEAVFGWLLAASWQASVLALFVLLIQRVLGSRLNPRWRYALWLLVVLRLILPAVPESALSLFQFAPPPPAVLTVSVSKPLFVSAPIIALPEISAEVPEPAHPFSIYSLLAVAWLVGALTLLVLTWQVNRRFARQVAASPALTDPDLWKLFAEAKAELGIRRSIRLVESAQVQSPAIMGLFQPTLLLPTDVRARFDATELRFIFLHELAHLKRGDVAVQALIALLQILHWFNPVLWFAFRRMRIDREPATDALVLSRTGEQEKERYGLMLIKLLEHFNQRHSLPTLVGILEDKDQFKRRFSLIARFTRGAYGWSLLGVIVIGILAIACLTKSKANEKAASTASDLITNLGRFVAGVDSMDYSETKGDPKGDHSTIHWQEMGNYQRVDIFEPNHGTDGKRQGNFHDILSYDGNHGYDYTPGSDRLRVQKEPFQNRIEGYSSGLSGPLPPFEFLDKRGDRPSSGRVTLQTLKSPDALAAVAARAVLAPDKNRSWAGHPCIAVKISGGNDRWDSQAPVDFVAYFARDLDLYPVAYEIYKHGKLSQSYCVLKFATIPTGKGGTQVFRYPELAKGFRYDSDTYHSSSGGGYSFDLTAPSDLKINTLTKADFTLQPPAGGYIQDLDSSKLIKVDDTPSKAANAASSLPPLYVRFDKNVRYDPTASGFFGPVGRIDSDMSLIPGTNQIISVKCESFTPTSAKLLFNRGWPTGTQPTPLPPADVTTLVEVPLGKNYSFRIFNSVDVTTSPTAPPPRPDMQTPLLIALYSHDDARIESLIAKKEPVILTDMEGAIEVGTPQQVKLLWDNGPHFISEMAYAVSQGASVGDLEKLFAKGVPVERPYDFITPLGIAARLGNVEVARWLLDHGADLHPNNDLLDLAVKGYSPEMISFLLQKGAQFDRQVDVLFIATGFGDFSDPILVRKRVAMINILIKAGALQYMTTDSKIGLLDESCRRKAPEFLHAYLDAGINPLDKDSHGKTALDRVKEAYSHRDIDPAVDGMQPLIDILEAAEKSAVIKTTEETPPRQDASSEALPYPLDLKPVYTKVFAQPDGSDSTYRGYAGRKIIDGLPFDVGGDSTLFGKSLAERGKDYPETITIPIGHTFDELHLIHAAQWRDYYGCPVAVLRLHYADGTHYDFPIRFDFQVNDWSRLYTEDEEIVADPDTKIIWRGTGGAEGLGRLFKSVLRNPFPAKKVDSLEAIAAGHNASYTLVAATIAQSDPHREVTAGMPLVPARHFDGTLNVIVLDKNTGAPIVGAEVYPAMTIGDINLVADTVLTGADGVAPVKYPKDGTKELEVEVAKDGYLTNDDNWNNGWQAGSIPPDVTYLLTPGRDPALDARRVTGHWKLTPGTPAGFDINQVNLYLSPKMAPPPFPPEVDTSDKKQKWFQDWLKTNAGKQFIAKQRMGRMLQLKAEGTFNGESVAPGEYISAWISTDGREMQVTPHDVVIPPNPGTDPNTPVDVGEIELQTPASPPVPPTTTVNPAGVDADDEAYFHAALEMDQRMTASSGIVSSTLAADARMLEAIQRGDVAALKDVLEHAVDPDRFDSFPAYWAVHFNQPEILKLLLEHMAAGDRGPANGSALRLAQKIHPELVPILQEGIKRNRDRLTAQLTAQMHSTHIDLPAFSNVPLQKVVSYLLEATSKVGYLERRVTIGTMDIPASTTLIFPARPNVTLWDAVQTIADTNKLRFVVGEEDITFYPPKDEAIIHPPTETKNAPAYAGLEPPAADLNISKPKPLTVTDPLKESLNFNLAPATTGGGTTVVSGSSVYRSSVLVRPVRNPAFDHTLIDVARDGHTDKVGKGDAIRIAQLIGEGADPTAKDKDGTSALVWALNFGKDDAAQVLLKNGADASVVVAGGQKPAWLAASIYLCPGALELMIKKGADVKSPDKNGNSIFYEMASAPEPAAGKMNYLNDRAWTDAEFEAYQDRQRRTVDLLVSAGVDINGRSGPEAKTPLMLAAQHGHTEMARELIAHGADVSLKDANGETAAALAQMYGHPGLLPLLEAKPVGR